MRLDNEKSVEYFKDREKEFIDILVDHLNNYTLTVFNDLLCFVSNLIATISLHESELFVKSGFIDNVIELFIQRSLKSNYQIKQALEVIDEFYTYIDYEVILESCNNHPNLVASLFDELERSTNDDTTNYFIIRILRFIFQAWKETCDDDFSKEQTLLTIKQDDKMIELFKDIERDTAKRKITDLHAEVVELIMVLDEDIEVSII